MFSKITAAAAGILALEVSANAYYPSTYYPTHGHGYYQQHQHDAYVHQPQATVITYNYPGYGARPHVPASYTGHGHGYYPYSAYTIPGSYVAEGQAASATCTDTTNLQFSATQAAFQPITLTPIAINAAANDVVSFIIY